MIITRNPDALDLPLPLDLSQGTSVTVGNFDGVHLGHQALLAMTCERAAATGTLPVAMTFNPHPLEVLTPYAPPRLTTPQARLALLEASGMALVMLVVFTSEFAAMSPETFVRRILLGTLNMRELLLGYDFTSAFEYEAFTLSGWLSQNHSSSFQLTYAVHNPAVHAPRFRLLPFRSPLLRKSMFLSLPPAT